MTDDHFSPGIEQGTPGLALPAHRVVADWANVSAVPQGAAAWAHSGLVATSAGELIGFHAGRLVAFDRQGHLIRALDSELTEGHGITLVRERDEESLWICDPGFLFYRSEDDGDEGLAMMFGKGLRQVSRQPRVVKMTLAGAIVLELQLPPDAPQFSPGPMGSYRPCGTAVAEERLGGDGSIWVADGYGSSLVHHFDREGHFLATLSGDEGAGRFDCPHAVYIDRRTEPAQLYVADRGNKRVQVFDLDGSYRRSFGEDFLNSPSGFAQWGDLLVIAELFGRLVAVDSEDNLVGYIGADPDAEAEAGWPQRPGWPNVISDSGYAEAPIPVVPGRFNSPHSVAVDADGTLYVSEWLLGGRCSKVIVATDHADDAQGLL